MAGKIGFIGTGNMGASILKGVIRSGTARPEDIFIFDADRHKAAALAKETGVAAAASNSELVQLSDYIILAVKPVFVGQVMEEIKDSYSNEKVLVSIAVGVSSDTLRSYLCKESKIVRTMPNLPLMVGEGMTLICFDDNIGSEEKVFVKRLFEGSGRAEELEERLMSQVTALTGSSPAYVFVMIEAMADGAVAQGIPRKLAYKLAAQAVLGSAKMVLETGLHPAELKDQVCSPAGTTIEAVKSLERNGFRYSLIDAMDECTARALEIGRESGSK
jgi:pyrroline-5-carboxylate reductase